MKDEEEMNLPAIPDEEELNHLIDAFLEGRISPEEKNELEQRLRHDETAVAHCVDRIEFNALLEELMNPVRVEVIQKRHLVYERVNGLPRFSVKQSQVVRIGNPKSGNYLEIPPGLAAKPMIPKAMWAAILILAVIIFALAFGLYRYYSVATAETPATLVLKNGDFELTDLSDDEDAMTYTLLDWQDFFMTDKARVLEVARYSKQAVRAKSGKNVLLLEPDGGFVAQRLAFDNGEPLTVQANLRIRIKGWVYGLKSDADKTALRLALRVVKGVRPEMRQFEIDFKFFSVEAGLWKAFEADLVVSEESLRMAPRFVHKRGERIKETNLEGEYLSLAIDNRGTKNFYVDDLSVEIVPVEPVD